MKRIVLTSLALTSLAFAQAPTVNITGPTGTIFVPSFPAPATITLTLTAGSGYDLSNVNALKIEVGGTVVLNVDNTGKPFDNAGCKQPPLPTNVACSVDSGLTQATLGVPWMVPGPGDYVITVSLKHRGDTGTDVESVHFALLAASYPAPPSVANEYINGIPALKNLAAKTRGCVVSEIAREHGQNSKYGPKSGPYDKPLIYSDVQTFWTSPCGGTWPSSVQRSR